MKLRVEVRGQAVVLDDGLLAPYHERLADLGPAPPVRRVFAAARIVMRAEYEQVGHSLSSPAKPEEITPFIDWESTLAQRKRLSRLGFGIAEAMDTAQRFHIGWANARRLIEITGAARLKRGFVAGAGVDHLERVEDEDQLVAGVLHQVQMIQQAGGIAILLPLLWLPEHDGSEADYLRVYRRIIEGAEGPLLVHWLGEMFLPALRGYFPGKSFESVMAIDPDKVRGAKLSLLDAELEGRLRRELAKHNQFMLTGDDFHFGELMDGAAGEERADFCGESIPIGDFSHGLLGVFDGIAEPASLALRFLAHGDRETYRELMGPCEVLGRHLFETPTQHYKAGLAFLSWLNGAQGNPMLALHEERARSAEHYLRAAELASAAGAIQDSSVAAGRLSKL